MMSVILVDEIQSVGGIVADGKIDAADAMKNLLPSLSPSIKEDVFPPDVEDDDDEGDDTDTGYADGNVGRDIFLTVVHGSW